MNSNKLWGTSGLECYVRERDPSLSHPPSSPPSICKKYYPKHLRQLSYRDAMKYICLCSSPDHIWQAHRTCVFLAKNI